MDSCDLCGSELLLDIERDSGRCVDCESTIYEQECDEQLARFREMFPVAPWSTDPITAEVCELLGMVRDGRWWGCPQSGVAVFDCGDGKPFVRGMGYGLNAGQLALFLAARKNQNGGGSNSAPKPGG